MKRKKSSWLVCFLLIFLLSNCATPSVQKGGTLESTLSESPLSISVDSIEPIEVNSSMLKSITKDLDVSPQVINSPSEGRGQGDGNRDGGRNRMEDLILKKDGAVPQNLLIAENNSSVQRVKEHSSISGQTQPVDVFGDKPTKQDINETFNPEMELKESVRLDNRENNQTFNQQNDLQPDHASGEIDSSDLKSKLSSDVDPKVVNDGAGVGLESYFISEGTNDLVLEPESVELGSGPANQLVKEKKKEIGFNDIISISEIFDSEANVIDVNKSMNEIPKEGVDLSTSLLPKSKSMVSPSQSGLKPMSEMQNNVNIQSDQFEVLEDEIGTKTPRVGIKSRRLNPSYETTQTLSKLSFKDNTDLIPLRNDKSTNPNGYQKNEKTSQNYGRIRSFLNRNESAKGIEIKKETQEFNRAKRYLNAERKSINPKVILEGQKLKGNRYQKTLEWIKNRGRNEPNSTFE